MATPWISGPSLVRGAAEHTLHLPARDRLTKRPFEETCQAPTRWPPRQSIPRLANSSRNQALATGPGAIHRRAGSRGLESRLTPSVTRRSTQKPTPMANLARGCSVFYLRWKRARTEGPREHESDQEDWSGPSNDSRRCQLHCCPYPACSRHAHRSPIQNPGSVQ